MNLLRVRVGYARGFFTEHLLLRGRDVGVNSRLYMKIRWWLEDVYAPHMVGVWPMWLVGARCLRGGGGGGARGLRGCGGWGRGRRGDMNPARRKLGSKCLAVWRLSF
jgi:hypothetical protein